MKAPVKYIHTMTGAPTGDVIDLGASYSKVVVSARAEVVIQGFPQSPGAATAPSAPSATMIPGAGAGNLSAAGVSHLKALDQDTFQPDLSELTKWRYFTVWELAAGDLSFECWP